MLLDLYLRAGRTSSGHPEVRQLSDILVRWGKARGAARLPSFQSPAGVSRKLTGMAHQDAEYRATGLKGQRACAADEAVWWCFRDRPEALALEVRRILGDLAAGRSVGAARPSQGPVPAFGTFKTVRENGRTVVYVLAFDGPIAALYGPGRVPDGFAVLKVGRSGEAAGRIRELCAGFLPGADLAWGGGSMRRPIRLRQRRTRWSSGFSVSARPRAGRSVANS